MAACIFNVVRNYNFFAASFPDCTFDNESVDLHLSFPFNVKDDVYDIGENLAYIYQPDIIKSFYISKHITD